MRIGHGYDVHAFSADAGEHLVRLGGVDVPHDRGVIAHSDGDVMLHALMDALLGALALGDIGQHFPDTDPAWRDADSRLMLRALNEKINGGGFRLGNADITIVAQAPRVASFVPAMRAAIAEDLSADIDQVSVKATTTEKLGFLGRREGLAAEAVVLLEPVAS